MPMGWMWDEEKEGHGVGVQAFYFSCKGVVMVLFTFLGRTWRGPGLGPEVVWMENHRV